MKSVSNIRDYIRLLYISAITEAQNKKGVYTNIHIQEIIWKQNIIKEKKINKKTKLQVNSWTENPSIIIKIDFQMISNQNIFPDNFLNEFRNPV